MLETILKKEIIAPVLIILISMTLYFIITKLIDRFYKIKFSSRNDKKRETVKGLVNNIIKYFIIVVDLAMILEVYGIDTKSLIASLGVVSLVAGLALQDVLKDFIVGISILLEEQYAIGDTVEIGGFKGTIVKFGLRATHIKAYTGETKIVANRNITELINYNKASGVAVVDVMFSYESDLLYTKKVIEKLCEEVAKEKNAQIECLGVDQLADNGVIVKVAITTSYEDKASVARYFNEKVKLKFDEEGIEIPYPQMVVHNGKGI